MVALFEAQTCKQKAVDVTTMVTGNDDCGNANSWRSKRPKESDEVVQWEAAGGIAVWNFTLPYDAPREVAAALSTRFSEPHEN